MATRRSSLHIQSKVKEASSDEDSPGSRSEDGWGKKYASFESALSPTPLSASEREYLNNLKKLTISAQSDDTETRPLPLQMKLATETSLSPCASTMLMDSAEGYSVAASPDGKLLAVGCQLGIIQVFRSPNLEHIQTLDLTKMKGGSPALNCVCTSLCFLPPTDSSSSSSHGPPYQPHPPNSIHQASRHNPVSPSASQHHHHMEPSETVTPKLAASLSGSENLSLSPDPAAVPRDYEYEKFRSGQYTYALLVAQGERWCIVHPGTESILAQRLEPGNTIRCVSFRPDGLCFATAGEDHAVRVYGLHNRYAPSSMGGGVPTAAAAIFSNQHQPHHPHSSASGHQSGSYGSQFSSHASPSPSPSPSTLAYQPKGFISSMGLVSPSQTPTPGIFSNATASNSIISNSNIASNGLSSHGTSSSMHPLSPLPPSPSLPSPNHGHSGVQSNVVGSNAFHGPLDATNNYGGWNSVSDDLDSGPAEGAGSGSGFSWRLMRKMDSGDGEVTYGHTGPIFALAWKPEDPNMLLSGGWDKSIQIWNVRLGRAVGAMIGPYLCGEGLGVSGSLVITGSWRDDSPLQLWDLTTRSLSTNLPWVQPHYGACFVYSAGIAYPSSIASISHHNNNSNSNSNATATSGGGASSERDGKGGGGNANGSTKSKRIIVYGGGSGTLPVVRLYSVGGPGDVRPIGTMPSPSRRVIHAITPVPNGSSGMTNHNKISNNTVNASGFNGTSNANISNSSSRSNANGNIAAISNDNSNGGENGVNNNGVSNNSTAINNSGNKHALSQGVTLAILTNKSLHLLNV